MKKNIIISTVLILAAITLIAYYFTYRQSLVLAAQEFADTGYVISIKYPKDDYKLNKGSRISEDKSDKAAWIRLSKPDSEDIYIDIRYEFKNNGDDSPIKSDIETGAPPWPPQPEDLMEDFDTDKFIYLGKYLGKELYVSKQPNFTMGVVQKLQNGKVTPNIPLLSKNKERVNYYDYFSIIANARGADFTKSDYEQLHKEFLQILKTLRIEKMK